MLGDEERDGGCSAAGDMLAWEGLVACNPTSATTWWRRVRWGVSWAGRAWSASGPVVAEQQRADRRCCYRQLRAAATRSGPVVANTGPLRAAGLSI